MEGDQLGVNHSMIPIFNVSKSMSLQIQTGLAHLKNMLHKLESSQTKTTLDFLAYCQNEIDPYCRKLQVSIENITSCIEKMKKEYDQKVEKLTNQKGQAKEKLCTVTLEQTINEKKIAYCEEKIEEANNAKQKCLEKIEDADEKIRKIELKIKEKVSQGYFVNGIMAVACVASFSNPLTIPAAFVTAAMAGTNIGICDDLNNFAKRRFAEKSNQEELEEMLQIKTTELECMQIERKYLEQKICKQKQSIRDLSNEISTAKQQMNITVDVLLRTHYVYRSVNNLSGTMKVLKFESTNAYALEPLMAPFTELCTNLHQLFRFFPKRDRAEFEGTMTHIEDRLKTITEIKLKESMESFF